MVIFVELGKLSLLLQHYRNFFKNTITVHDCVPDALFGCHLFAPRSFLIILELLQLDHEGKRL